MIRAKSLLIILAVTALVLSIPLVAMQFSDEWDWQPFDFMVIGALLVGAGLLFEILSQTVTRPFHRVLIGAVLLIGMLLLYVHFAVGLFDGLPLAGS